MYNQMSGSYGHENMFFLYSYGASSPSHIAGPVNIFSGSSASENTWLPYTVNNDYSTQKSKQHKVIPSASLHIRAAGANVHPQMIVSQYSSGDVGLTFDIAGTRQYSMGIDNSDSDKFKINVDAEADPRNANPSAGTTALSINTSSDVLIHRQISFPANSVSDPGSDETVNIGSSDQTTNADVFRIYTNDGYTDIGSKTTSFSFFDTDRAGFFFQKSAIFDDQSTDSNLGVAGVMSNDSDFYVRRDYNDTGYSQIALKSTTIDFHVNTSSAEFQMQADGDFHADGDIIAYSTSVSDRRLKTNFVEIKPKEALEKLLSLQGYEFEWKHKDDGIHYGVIAQDLLEVLPHAVVEKKIPFYDGTKDEPTDIYKEEWKKEQGIEDDKYYTARYEEIIPVMIEGMKELNQKISKLEKEVEELKNGNKNR